MRNVKARRVECIVVEFDNDRGEHIVIPIYNRGNQITTFGSYQVFGTSRSDPTFSAVHGLPYKWRPRGKILAAIRRTTQQGR